MSAADVRNQPLAVAQAYAAQHGWPWLEPVDVRLLRETPDGNIWSIRTNAFAVGRNVRVVVRESDLTAIDAGFLPR